MLLAEASVAAAVSSAVCLVLFLAGVGLILRRRRHIDRLFDQHVHDIDVA